MEKLKEFMKSNEVDFTKNLVSNEELDEILKSCNLTMSEELKSYIISFGYLGFKHIEFCGINSFQKEKSDLITQSLNLHKYFPKTCDYLVLESQGEGGYILVDKNSCVFDFDANNDSLKPLNKTLYEYIYERFNEIK